MIVQGSGLQASSLGKTLVRQVADRAETAVPARDNAMEIPAVRVQISSAGKSASARGGSREKAEGTPGVRVQSSAVARKFRLDEKSAGPASARLQTMDAEEEERQRKLQYMQSLEARLEDESLTAEDRKTLESDVAWLKKETMTNRDKIEELTVEMKALEKEHPFFDAGKFYSALIKPRIDWQEAHDQEVRELQQQARQEKAGVEAEAMGEEAVAEAPDDAAAQDALAAELLKAQAKVSERDALPNGADLRAARSKQENAAETGRAQRLG